VQGGQKLSVIDDHARAFDGSALEVESRSSMAKFN